jgi:hypothetical protein
MVTTGKKRDIEHTEQARFFAIIRKLAHPAVQWTFAVPNGFLETSSKRIRAWREGMQSGVWDVFVPYPSKGFHGLFIEFKSPTGTLSDHQKAFCNTVGPRGYKMEVVRSYKQALFVLQDYLSPDEKTNL